MLTTQWNVSDQDLIVKSAGEREKEKSRKNAIRELENQNMMTMSASCALARGSSFYCPTDLIARGFFHGTLQRNARHTPRQNHADIGGCIS